MIQYLLRPRFVGVILNTRKYSIYNVTEVLNGEEGLKWINALLGAMKKNIGGYVTHPFNMKDNSTVKRDTVYKMPRNVGIIINERNASSAEQFLLAARQSDKVILETLVLPGFWIIQILHLLHFLLTNTNYGVQ